MLTLTRNLSNNEIIIGDNLITITVKEIRGNQVRLGIEAPKEISIHRSEIFYKINYLKNNNINPDENYSFNTKISNGELDINSEDENENLY